MRFKNLTVFDTTLNIHPSDDDDKRKVRAAQLSSSSKENVHYPSFEAMLRTEKLKHVLPGVPDVESGVKVYRKFYTKDKERELHGGFTSAWVRAGKALRGRDIFYVGSSRYYLYSLECPTNPVHAAPPPPNHVTPPNIVRVSLCVQHPPTAPPYTRLCTGLHTGPRNSANKRSNLANRSTRLLRWPNGPRPYAQKVAAT